MQKIGFSTIACPDYDIDQVIDIAKRNGYSSVEIRFLRGTIDLASLAEFSPGQISDTRRRFEDAGVAVLAVDTSVRMNSVDPVIREQNRALARANLAIAVGLGAPMMRVFGGPIPADQDLERTLDGIASGLGEIAGMTREQGVLCVLETHDDFSTSARCLELYKRGASDALHILWDTLHTHRFGETPEFTWEKLGPRIRHVHIKDSFVANSKGFDFAPTGEGTVPIAAFLDLLKQKSYQGAVHFEWEKGWHKEISGPEIALPHFARYVAGLK